MKLHEIIKQDIRYKEAVNACMNCGMCTSVCPAAEFSDYDPRILMNIVQTQDDSEIEKLLKSDFIWLCGQCMSCKTRCPRSNVPGLLINVLRRYSQELGYFTESRRGRQQYALNKVLNGNILNHGYCIVPQAVKPELHPEQGTVWEWIYRNAEEFYDRMGANLNKEGAGVLRKIDDDTMDELHKIFEETGANFLKDKIDEFSKKKAEELGYNTDENGMEQYFLDTYKGKI
ncbi:MAG: 4Fe-4S dicluster domain-containing protein [Bacteroidales bacterium]|nr:4Fe-4S dicluster domain-containing protein [Bacteroidales bacterium]